MRVELAFGLLLATACTLAGCSAVGLVGGPGVSEAWACTQCNIAYRSAGECSACKAQLQIVQTGEACPRCRMEARGNCPNCGQRVVPAVQYFRCPSCGKTVGSWEEPQEARRGPGELRADCTCGSEMRLQVVPLRVWCPDCRLRSGREGACPRCGSEMIPL